MKEFSKICFVVGVCLANVIAGESWSVLLRSHSVYTRRNFTNNSSSTVEPTASNLTESTDGSSSTTESSTGTTESTNVTSADVRNSNETLQQNATSSTSGVELGISTSTSSDGLWRIFKRRNSSRPSVDRDWKVVVNREITTQNSLGSESSTSAPINLKLPTQSAGNASSVGSATSESVPTDNSTKTVVDPSNKTLSLD